MENSKTASLRKVRSRLLTEVVVYERFQIFDGWSLIAGSCLRADVSYFLCSACNKGNRRRPNPGTAGGRIWRFAKSGEICQN